MRPKSSRNRVFYRVAAGFSLTFAAATIGCSDTTEPPSDASTLTHISGNSQTVTLDPVSTLTNLPQLVVVRLDSSGTPLPGRQLHVAVQMSGAPGANGPYEFRTGSDGTAAMQLQVSNIPGPVGIGVSYMKCVKPGFFVDCDQWRPVTTLGLSALAVR